MLIRLSTPSGLAVPLDYVKETLHILTTEFDDRLERLIRDQTRRYEDFTGRFMLPTEVEWRSENWGYFGFIALPVAPVRSVSEVAYLDTEHAEQILDPSDWYLITPDHAEWQLWWTDVFNAPGYSDRPQPIRVRMIVGHDEPGVSGSGDDAELAPVLQDQGVITSMVGWLFDKDEALPDELLRRMANNRRIYR